MSGVDLRPVRTHAKDGYHLPPDSAIEAVLFIMGKLLPFLRKPATYHRFPPAGAW
jgi:hypothetical protein